MKRLEDMLNIDLPLPARFTAPRFPNPLEDVDVDLGDEDGDEETESEADDAEPDAPGTIHFGDAPDEPSEAENLGDDFFGESAGSTRATGRKKFDEDEEGAEEEDLNLDEIDDDAEEDGEAVQEGDSDIDDDDEFDDDDDDLDDDDDDFDDDE